MVEREKTKNDVQCFLVDFSKTQHFLLFSMQITKNVLLTPKVTDSRNIPSKHIQDMKEDHNQQYKKQNTPFLQISLITEH